MNLVWMRQFKALELCFMPEGLGISVHIDTLSQAHIYIYIYFGNEFSKHSVNMFKIGFSLSQRTAFVSFIYLKSMNFFVSKQGKASHFGKNLLRAGHKNFQFLKA